MIDTLLVRAHGGIWRVKERCMASHSRFLLLLYNAYLANRGSFIGYQSTMSSAPILPHGFSGIFISNAAKIGKNCVIFHQVTIGSNTLAGSKGAGSPTIGDNCYIGAGAKIIGGIRLGNNVRVGANCTVFQDIPDNSVVVSPEPIVIQKEHLNNRYYSKRRDGWVFVDDGKLVPEQDSEIIRSLSRDGQDL